MPKILIQVFLLFLATMTFSTTWAQSGGDGRLNVVYRGSDGKLSKDSKYFARVLAQKAHANGTVALWLTLNIPYETNQSAMSAEEIAAQQASVRRSCAELLNPLVARRAAIHPNGELASDANGCRILVTAQGVRALVADKRVLHLIETRVR